jgi:hypothetical protein
MPTSPAVASLELSIRLRQRRMELGMDIKTITDLLKFTRNHWSAIEHDRKLLAVEKLHTLLDAYNVDDPERQELLDLRALAGQKGWWTRYSGLPSDDMLRFYGLEHGAISSRNYEGTVIPGLLQTEDYARAVIGADLRPGPVAVNKLVELRMRRQQRLVGEDPLHLTVVLGEAALAQHVAAPATQRTQLAHLVAKTEEHPDNLELRVIPFTTPPGSIQWSPSLQLLDFDSPRIPTFIWGESVVAAGGIDDDYQVQHLSMVYGQALERSLGREESVDLIQQRLGQLG